MNGLILKFRQLFARAKAEPETPVLPPEIQEHIAAGRLNETGNYIQRLLAADGKAPEVGLIAAEARRHRWPAIDMEKLDALIHYCRGEFCAGFPARRKILRGGGFRPLPFRDRGAKPLPPEPV